MEIKKLFHKANVVYGLLLDAKNYGRRMKRYDQKHGRDDDMVLLAWMIVFFSFVILYLIWHAYGYI